MKQIYIAFVFVLCIYNSIPAQDSIVKPDVRLNYQIWLDYNFTSSINDHLNLNTQIGFRKITPEIYNRFLVISTLNIKNEKKLIDLNNKNPFIKSFHFGSGLIYTQNYNNNDNFEFRLIQGFKFEIPTIPTITLDNFVRLEERFQNPFNDSGWTSAFRLRYKISTILNWKKHYLKFTDGLYIPIQTEFFFNLKRASRYNDLIRLSPGLGYKSENDWRYELYVIFNKTKNITETTNKSNDFILRLRIYQGHPTKQVFDFDQEDTF